MKKFKFSPIFLFFLFIFPIAYSSVDEEKEKYSRLYHDRLLSEVESDDTYYAVSYEEELQYGAPVSYISLSGDTLIPFGNYAYLGTDTMKHYANVIELNADGTWGVWVAIDRNQQVLYEIVVFDNGPDYFSEGLVRVWRNGKMGFANENGEVVIPCIYDFAYPYQEGMAKVTFHANEKRVDDEHRMMVSDEWFHIDKKGKTMEEE